MADEIIVAVFENPGQADGAIHDLHAAGLPSDTISRHADSDAASSPIAATIAGFWTSLFGGHPGHDTAVYDRSVQSGATVVTVKVPAMLAARVCETLESYQPIDIDERAAGYGLTPPPAPSGTGQSLLNVGTSRVRRYVPSGGTRA